MDNFPVSHFLTSNTSTTTTTASSSKTMATTTTATTHDDSHNNSQLISSIYEPFMSFSTSTTTWANPQYCYPAPLYLPHSQGLQFPAGVCQTGSAGRHRPAGFAYRPLVVAGQNVGAVLVGVSKEEERRLLDAWTTKVARSKRRLARQRSLNLITRNSSPNSSSSYTSTTTTHHGAANSCTTTALGDSRELPISGAGNRDLYTFFTPDKKRLRLLLKKELKNSDVGSLGRIVLPKREAEEKLPTLSDKEGIQVVMRDIHSHQEWSLRYKYWSNNKSRMYVLENTGDFVKQNGLEIGDSITLYEDECKNLYVSIKKGARQAAEPSNKRHLTNKNAIVEDNNSTSSTTSDEVHDNKNVHSKTSNYDNSSYASYAYELSRDEEDASLALLIEQLNHKEQQEANSLVTTLSHIGYDNNNASSSYGQSNQSSTTTRSSNYYYNVVSHEGKSSIQPTSIEVVEPPPPPPLPSSSCSKGKVQGDDHFDDCYGGLGTLPEVDGQYEYYSYATLFDRIMSDD